MIRRLFFYPRSFFPESRRRLFPFALGAPGPLYIPSRPRKPGDSEEEELQAVARRRLALWHSAWMPRPKRAGELLDEEAPAPRAPRLYTLWPLPAAAVFIPRPRKPSFWEEEEASPPGPKRRLFTLWPAPPPPAAVVPDITFTARRLGSVFTAGPLGTVFRARPLGSVFTAGDR